jgi:putative hemolysin
MTRAHFDVRHLLRQRAPKLERSLPNALMSGLARLLHEREIDAFLGAHPAARGLAMVDLLLAELQIKVSCRGLEGLNPHGRYLFVANHPNGAIDGLAILSALGAFFGDAGIIANSLVTTIEPLAELFVAVNKHGPQRRADARSLRAVLLTDRPLVVFPAGEVSKLGAKGVADVGWRQSFVKMAQRSGRDIVPLFMADRASWRFHALSVVRRALRVSFHAEMLLLVHELDQMRGRHQQILVKEPLRHAWLASRRGAQVMTETRARVYAENEGAGWTQSRREEYA